MDADRIIKINYGGLSTDNFLSSTPNSLITIPANLSSVNVSIITADDSTFDATGKFDISIAPAEPPETANYTISSTKKSFEVLINDNDARDSTITGVSIHAITTTVTSENVVRFLLVAPQVLTRAHTYTVHVTERASDSVLKSTQDLSNCIYNTLETPNRVQCSVEIRGNTQTGEFEIELNDDEIDEGNSIITATIIRATLPEQNPTAISETNNSVMVTIMDDDAPPTLKLEVKSTLTNNSIVETHMDQNIEFEFKVKTDAMSGITTTSSASNLTIQYSVIENVGDFLLPSQESQRNNHKTAQLNALATSGTFSVSVNGDAVDEINGNFTVTIEDDVDSNNPKTYLVSQVAEERSITINVTDDEIPVLSVDTAKTSTSITEGENIEIVIKSDIAPYQDLDLELCAIEKSSGAIANCERRILFPPSSQGSFLPSNNAVQNVKFLAATIENTFTINIDDDDLIEERGAVIAYFNIMTCPATIATGNTQGFCSTLTSSVTASITVTDDDPEISIAAVDANNSIIDGNGLINEGETAKFRLTSNQPAPAGGIDVTLNITQIEQYLDTTAITFNMDTPPVANLTVAIMENQSTADFTLNTKAEDMNNRSGSVTVEIAEPSDPSAYSRDTKYSVTTWVTDIHNSTPEIYIQTVSADDGQTTPVREYDSARFVLTSSKAITTPLNVLVCVSDGMNHSVNPGCTAHSGVGDYLTDSIPISVFMPASSTNLSAEFEVPLEDDAEIENVGEIHVTVVKREDDETYRIHSQNTAIVFVRSNDPTMSIAAKSLTYTEGTDAEAIFVVTTNATVTEDTRVRVNIESPSGDFINDQITVVFAEFTSSDTELGTEIKIPIIDDEMEERNGSIKATLDTQGLESANYFLVSDDHPSLSTSAIVSVLNDDGGIKLPVVSIAADNMSVTEGSPVIFSIRTQEPLAVGVTLAVKIMIEQEVGNYIAGSIGNLPKSVDVIGMTNSSTGSLQIATTNIGAETDNGRIKVTLVADDENYTLGANANASVVILDSSNVTKPVISISESTGQINEGQSVTFTLTSSSAPSNDLSVNLKVTQDNDNFIPFRVPRTVIIQENNRTASLVLKTDRNNTNSGRIFVELLSGSGYNVGALRSDFVQVEVAPKNPSNEDERIAVAEIAVNKILDILPSLALGSGSPENPTPTLPLVSIASMSSSVEEGHPVQFLVTTSSLNINNLSVQVELSGTPGTLERDYSIAVTLNTSRNSEVIEIPTINDDYAGENGLVTARLREDSSYQIESDPVATVSVLDTEDRERRRNELETANREVLTQIFGTANHATRSAINERVQLAFSEDINSSISLGGYQDIRDFIGFTGQSINNETATLESLFGNSSFSIELAPEEVGYGSLSIWGVGEQHDLFNGETHSSESWSNEMFIGQVGTDVRIGNRGIAGLSVLASNSDAKYKLTESDTIAYKSKTNSYNSYIGWNSDEHDLQFHAATRLGSGEIELVQDHYVPLSFKSDLYALTLSGEKVLYSTTGILNNFATEISIQGNSHWSKINLVNTDGFLHDQSYDSHETNLGVNLDNQFRSKTGTIFQFNASLGGHTFSKINHSNSDLISEVEIALTNQFGLNITNFGQFVMDRESFTPEYFSLRNRVSYDQGHDKLGTLMEVSQSYGQMQGGNSRSLWSSDILESFSETGLYMDGVHVDTELGYGLSILGDTSRLTPFGGIDYSNDADNKYHVGTRLQLGSDLKFELTGTQETDTEGSLNQKIKLDGALNW